MNRPSALLVLAALSFSLLSCSDDPDVSSAPSTTPTPSASSAAASPAVSASTRPSASPSDPAASPAASSPAGSRAVAVYYLVDLPQLGFRLTREFRSRPPAPSPVADAIEAMLELDPLDGDYVSLWPEATRLLGVEITNKVAVVDLSREALSPAAGSEAEAATLQQLVFTATAAAPELTGVRVLIEGESRETLWGHVDISRQLRRAPHGEILAPVWLDVAEGAKLRRGGSVSGVASVFEATVDLEWLQEGRVVSAGFATAAEGAPGRGAWEAVVEVAPGTYTLRAFESSASSGARLFIDDKTVTVG